MNGTLILHCGVEEVTRDDIRRVQVPPATDTFQPIPHALLLDTALQELEKAGMAVKAERFGLSRGGKRFFGVLDLDSQIVEGVSLSIGLRNSVDKSLAAGIVMGTRVFVCDNLAFDAEIQVMRRHTRCILDDLPRRIEEAVGRIGGYAEVTEHRIRRMQGFPVDDRTCHDLIVQAAEKRCITWTDVPRVLKEWREPGHEEFAARNAWTLYNAFTEILKKSFQLNPETATARTLRLSGLFQSVLN